MKESEGMGRQESQVLDAVKKTNSSGNVMIICTCKIDFLLLC